MPNSLTGAPAAAAIYAQVRARAALLDAPPCLAAVSVGAQPDDLAYLRSIAQAAAGCGIAVRHVPLPADCAPDTLTDTLRALSADGGVHGVLLLRPLPEALRAQEILDTLDAYKDVDGMTTLSLGALVTGTAGFAPCTAEACMELLRAHGIDPAGKRVTVVGRSLVIGRPADDQAPAHDGHTLARWVDAVRAQQLHARLGRAGGKARRPGYECAER